VTLSHQRHCRSTVHKLH